jgi:DNA-binding NarL/FixJ family response regulator
VAGVRHRIRVLLVDDDALVRSGLSIMLDGAGDLEVVGEAGDGDEVGRAVDAHHPDVILMDVRMRRIDGITATRWVRARPEPPEVIVLTTFDTDEHILDALSAGASGFLLKDAPPNEIVEAIERVAAGESILSPTITRRLMQRVAAGADTARRAQETLAVLTEREREVAVAVGHGLSNAEIAATLHMSTATVKAHVSSILAKLHAPNRTHLALVVHDAGLA